MKDKELLLFTGTHCMPCQEFKKKFREAEEKYSDTEFIEVETDKEQSKHLIRAYKVRTIPTLVLLKNGIQIGEKIHPYSMQDIEDIFNM